jgi:YidC/Oxa1 family membrane protein insertase
VSSLGSVWGSFVDFFATVLRELADFFSFLGGHRWAAAIIVVTIVMRTLLLPLAIKQIRSMREMLRLAPEMQRIKQKYRSDRQKMTQETMALYQREGVNPYASCLPMVAQFPVLIAFYQALQSRILKLPAELAKQVKDKKLDGAVALALAQANGSIPHMPFLGLGDLARPASKTIAGWLLIVIMTAAQLITTRQLNPGQDERQKRMQMLMPFMFIIFFINFPAALVLYWTTQNVYQLVQQMIMTRGQRAKGWRAWIGIAKPEAGPRGGAGKRPPKEPKPQVRAPVKEPQPATVPAAGSSFDALANRRQLEEKRQRRRRNKKRKRKR